MSRTYRRCGGCHRTERYCDCKDYGIIDFDINAAKVSNVLQPAYAGTKCFGFYLVTQDGVSLHAPQFQSIAWDGTYFYIAACDKYDRDGCIIKYRSDWSLVKVGPCIYDMGHAKAGYNFADGYIYVAQRFYDGSWDATGMNKVDPDTLASVEFGHVGEHSISAFVQYDKELYCVGSDATKFYKVGKIDIAAGTIERELVSDIPVPGDFYAELAGSNNGMQAWYYDGRTITCIRNNPQFAMVYDTITKDISLTHIGDVSDGRYIGEIEGAFTWGNRTTLISVCDNQDPLQDANGVNYADIYIQVWYYDTKRGGSGSLDLRENTHTTYSQAARYWRDEDPTTNRSIIVNLDTNNFYCNGSQHFPFHSVHEALGYLRYHPIARSIQFQSDFDGFIRAFNAHCILNRGSNENVRIRFTDNYNCNWTLSGIKVHDCEFSDSWIFFAANNVVDTNFDFDKYYTGSGEVPKNTAHVIKRCIIWIGQTGQLGTDEPPTNLVHYNLTLSSSIEDTNIEECNNA